MRTASRRPDWRRIGVFALMALALWIPRGLALDRFVTPDEPKWLARSGNFYLALVTGHLAGTFTREHPGVTVTWIGTLGLLWRFPGYPQAAPGRLTDSRQIEPVIREQGFDPVEVLKASRVMMVAFITGLLILAFWQMSRLVGLGPALVGLALLAFDPFHIGLTRLLHLDGLVSSLMLVSLLAFLSFLYRGMRFFDLLISAVAAGLGWLTKSPAFFLAPFVALLGLIEVMRLAFAQHGLRMTDLWQTAKSLVVWGLLGWLVFFLIWPAMWVDPLRTVERVFSEAETYAAEGHTTETYFLGQAITGDPGRRFYPLTYLWRATPVGILGLALGGIAITAAGYVGIKSVRSRWKMGIDKLTGTENLPARVSSSAVLTDRAAFWTALALGLFAALFTLFMTLGSKKFDRYLLPVFAPLDLLAGIGLWSGASWLAGRSGRRYYQYLLLGILGVAVVLQAALALQTYPYYLSYYNPLLGGGERAPEVMMIGWGEGLDQAARYLNAKPQARELKVMAWYPDGVFSYFFAGQTVHAEPEWEQTEALLRQSDYVVTYIHQWQRGLPFPEMLELLAQQVPEHTISLNGIEYVRIYDISRLEGQ
ncbi:MAG TPA: hypothetical protein VJ436_02255 [Anaerolineales bacterium]|nr:hypothetical protein [Anaerolineales bacterium]